MRTFFLSLAVLVAISINPALGQQPTSKPVESGVVQTDASKVLSYNIKSTQPELKKPLKAIGKCVLPKGAVFPVNVGPLEITYDNSDGKPITITNYIIEGNKPLGKKVKVNGTFDIPVGTVLVDGFELTLCSSTPLPTPGKPPERVAVGMYDYTEDELAANPKLMAKLLMEHNRRLDKAEAAIKGLTAEMKAKRLALKPTGELLWTYDSKKQDELNGKAVVFRYTYTVCGDRYLRYVYEVVQ